MRGRSRQAEKKEKMHLSNELQKHLKKIGSSIELAKTIDKESPSNYAFYEPQKERNFRVYFGDKKSQFSIVFFERTKEKNYEICHLRGLFNSIIELAKAIKNWTEDENEIEEIANRFSNLEKYQFDDFENPDSRIDARWKYVRNSFFNDNKFWKNKNREERYFKMVDSAKRKDEWKNYYPFTSHYMLRFSLDNEIRHTWVLDLNIIPSWDLSKGNYKVNVPEEENKEGFYFDKLEDAIEFYDIKLKEHQPFKWN